MKSQKVRWIRLKVHILPVHRPWQYWNYRKWEFKMMDNFSSFCNSTSLHGWPHVPGAKTLERLFWLLTIALMVVLAASFCSRYRKGYPFPQVLSSCLWKWAFIAKKNFHLNCSFDSDKWIFHLSTLTEFQTSTVSTSLTSSTESVAQAKYPKIVICNKYQLR